MRECRNARDARERPVCWSWLRSCSPPVAVETMAPPLPAPSTFQMGGAIQGAALTLTTAVTTLAGTAGADGSTDGTGAAARFFHPHGITTDGASLYVADVVNNTVRKIQ